jgi:glycosyltransferase involved in cell wall biosynthesis
MTMPGQGRRLLIVADTLRGGVGGVVREQTEWFADHGWSVAVATPVADVGAPPARARHYEVAIPGSARDLPAMSRAIARLRSIIGHSPSTVIHCHGLRSFAIARLASSTRPYVTLHGTGGVLSDPIGYSAVRRLALGITPLLAEQAFNAGPEQWRGWTFMPHASPRLATLSRLPFPEPGPEPVFLWLGRLAEQKLPRLFVEAVGAAAKVTPLRGVLAGDGPLSEEIERLITELDAPIEVVGHIDDVQELLARCWAMVLFSRFEALTFSAQEAMWAGRAVISSPLPGIEWLLGDTGLIAADLASATEAIVRLTNRDEAVGLGSRAAIRIRDVMVPGAPWAALETAYLGHLDGVSRCGSSTTTRRR